MEDWTVFLRSDWLVLHHTVSVVLVTESNAAYRHIVCLCPLSYPSRMSQQQVHILEAATFSDMKALTSIHGPHHATNIEMQLKRSSKLSIATIPLLLLVFAVSTRAFPHN